MSNLSPRRLRRRLLVPAAVLVCAISLGAGALDFASYEWTEVNGSASWAARAGLQVVTLRNRFFLMGGRTPLDPATMPYPIPGASTIWGDVWTSDDLGATWTRILETDDEGHWPARAYFQAVTKDGAVFVLGGQNFRVEPNVCPPGVLGCPPFVSTSDFFSDVWRSRDGVNWSRLTGAAAWEPRAGLTSVVFKDEIYVLGGSQNDDSAVIGGPPVRIYFNDVWKSRDGATWQQVTEHAPWAPRAGAAAVVKDGYLYLLGGEFGFLCSPQPCAPPYFNDVWRTRDGVNWELVTASAGWSPRPGHQAVVILNTIVVFGGFGLSTDPSNPFAPGNPMDMWVSKDGAVWEQVSNSPWNAASPGDVKYDFKALAVEGGPGGMRPSIFTFGGDRETFDFFDPLNYLLVDNDVWRFSPPAR